MQVIAPIAPEVLDDLVHRELAAAGPCAVGDLRELILRTILLDEGHVRDSLQRLALANRIRRARDPEHWEVRR